MIHFNWKPGIGDPTIGGWITVVLYLLAMISCWMTARSGIKEQRIWTAISILFLGLGINKQLDLQSALTAAGRVIAFGQGWYDQRQFVQSAFIIFTAIVCASVVITLLIWNSSCAVIDLVCSARNDCSHWIRTNSRSLVSSHRPIYRHHLSWLTLELDSRDGWDHHCAVSEPMAPEKAKTSRLVSFVRVAIA